MVLSFPSYCLEAAALIPKPLTTGATAVNEPTPEQWPGKQLQPPLVPDSLGHVRYSAGVVFSPSFET